MPRAVTEYEERDNQNAANIEGTQITRRENSRNNPNPVDASKECNFKRLKYSSQFFLAIAVRYFQPHFKSLWVEGKGKFYISLQKATQLMGKAEDTWRTESQRRQKRAARGE